MRVAIVVAAAAGVPAAALGHVGIAPTLVTAGEPALITLDVPNERPVIAMTGLTLTTAPGTRILSAEASPGWAPRSSASGAAWTGTLAPGKSVMLAFELMAPRATGPLELRAVQHFADGESVSWALRLTVAPSGSSGSPSMRRGRAFVTGIVGLAAIAVGLVLARRRRLF